MSTTFTVRLPKQLADKMGEHGEINWSEVVRRAIEEYLDAIEETRTTVPAREIVGELKQKESGKKISSLLKPQRKNSSTRKW
ncbi:MAG: ribbon-helix-helix domain-containing protein [Desulfurococcales archaeon]|nr:ribbon-helix-helix domain-containing protein [Desulfurococcales archaeon]